MRKLPSPDKDRKRTRKPIDQEAKRRLTLQRQIERELKKIRDAEGS